MRSRYHLEEQMEGEEVYGKSKPVGIIKDAIKDAILDGVIPNSYDDAYQLMLEKANELNLKPVKSELRSSGLKS